MPYVAQVISVHRMPDEMYAYAKSARARGLRAIIAGAGGAAPLPEGVNGPASATVVNVWASLSSSAEAAARICR